jgi:peptidoglycan/LPS O-acetylase OafA/YrhL
VAGCGPDGVIRYIFKNLESGSFSFREFYSRRIRRIFPALLIVLAACYAIGWFTLLHNEFKQLGKHIAGGVGFISNLVLLGEAGYFDNKSETKPLLHLWSLGVEEQFYLIYPILLWLAWKLKLNLLALTALVAAASFWANMTIIEEDATTAFFSPQTRFWELMCGSLLAWQNLYGGSSILKIGDHLVGKRIIMTRANTAFFDDEKLKNMTACIGSLSVLFGVFYINKKFGFPGAWALIPVAGSALIIFSGPQAWVNRTILSSRILVWLGLISFPAYLWHWPLLSFPRIIDGEEPTQEYRIAAIFLTILLAWLTYKLIERPIRFGHHGARITTALVLFATVVGIIGYISYSKNGFPNRDGAIFKISRDGDTGHLDFHKYIVKNFFPCTPQHIAAEAMEWKGYTRCAQSKQHDRIDVVLIGDSHAEHLFIGVAEALPKKNVAFYIKGSPPLLDNPDFYNIYETIENSNTTKIVILTMRWARRKSQISKNLTLNGELIRIVDALSASGKRVILANSVPSFPFDVERCKGIRRFASNNTCEISYSSYNAETRTYIGSLTMVTKSRPSVKVLRVGKYLCGDRTCSMIKDNVVLYRDRTHLNIKGSSLVGERLVQDNLNLFR